MNWKIVVRLSFAIAFALVAFIFSDLVPNTFINRVLLRVLITLFFGLLGFGVSVDVVKTFTHWALSFANLITARVTSEMMSQIIRLPKSQSAPLSYGAGAPVGGITRNAPLILDTSAIIDGRLLDIAKTGFLGGTVLLPSFVLTELQQVADSADFLKRNRGRRGFDIVEDLKKTKGVRIEVWDKEVVGKGVDERLLKLAKILNGKIITTDFNLNKVASVSGVTVLNINDLANAVKTVAIPGEILKVRVIHLGKDPKQGVGYLDDGTMIVVEDGAELVGKEIEVEVSRILQVPAGKMIFTKPKS